MKNIFAAMLTILMCTSVFCASAETNLDTMTLEELLQLRSEVSNRIVEIYQQTEGDVPTGSLGTIAELFPDEPFAMAIRDALGKLSISQSVTQEELDNINDITVGGKSTFGEISSIEGIGYLRNLESLMFLNRAAAGLRELPEEFYSLTHMRYVYLSGTSLQSISPLIGNLVNLKTLVLSSSDLTNLPDELCNCTLLEELDISYTKITEVPPVLFSMPNVKVSMKGTDIK